MIKIIPHIINIDYASTCKASNGGKGDTVKKKNKELNYYFLAQHFVKP